MDDGRLTGEQIMAMRREAEYDQPRLGRMSCGELADVATTATWAVLALATGAVCTDWYDTPNADRIAELEARLEAAERERDIALKLMKEAMDGVVARAWSVGSPWQNHTFVVPRDWYRRFNEAYDALTHPALSSEEDA